MDFTGNKEIKIIEHQITFSGEKSFKCDQCEKSFANKSKLVCHQRTNTGEKPFKCDLCNKCFAEKGNACTSSQNAQWRKAI